jgi:hypothetical protein
MGYFSSGVQKLVVLKALAVATLVLFILSPCYSQQLDIVAACFTIRDMVEDGNGTIWVGTFGAGLWEKNSEGTRLFSASVDKQPFPMISNLLLDGNKLWIATAGGGCVCFNTKTRSFEPVKQLKGFSKLHGLFKTSGNELLIGSVGSGTAILNSKAQNPAWENIASRTLQHLSWVNHIDEWEGKIWLGTATGLYHTNARDLKKNWAPASAGLGEGVNHLFPTKDLLYISTTTRGVFAMKPGKQPFPIADTFGEIYFVTRFRDKLIGGGKYGLWEIKNKKGYQISSFPDFAAKSFLVTKNNTLFIGTMDGRIISTEDLKEFNHVLNLQQLVSEGAK